MASGGLDNPNKDPLLMNRDLSDAEIDQVVAFLETLSGNVVWTPPAVPQ
jgi:cytochrome c peroxidase